MRLLSNARIRPAEVTFAHPAPPDPGPYERFFDGPVRFGQPSTVMHLVPAQLAMPIPRADPVLGSLLREAASRALAEVGSATPATAPTSLAGQLRDIMAEELQRGGPPGVAAIARRLGMSTRTLRRRLDEEGGSFRELVDDIRADLARGYLADLRLPVSEVAFLLGFSELSAFHRAFRRWEGTTPAAYRQALGARGRAAPGSR
jgi:AraC-like DNA-binding protein